MANVLASLMQNAGNQQQIASQGARDFRDFGAKFKGDMERKKLQEVGREFISLGDYSAESIKNFAETKKLNQNEMMQIVQLASEFNKFKASAAPKTTIQKIIDESGTPQTGIYNATKGNLIAPIGQSGLSPEQKLLNKINEIKATREVSDPLDIQKSIDKQKALFPGRKKEIEFKAEQTAVKLAENPPTTLPEKMDAEGKLRKEFQSRKGVKAYEILRPQVDRIDSLMTDVNSGATKNFVAVDQALITIYNKMLDENSVVRESEYARTAENISLFNRIKGTLGKQVRGGTSLTDNDRNSIYDAIKKFDTIANSDYNDKAKFYTGLASSYQLDPERIVQSGFGATQPEKVQATTQGVTQSTGDPAVDDFLIDFLGDK